ncbi:FhaA domain-containing protein [Kocuria sp. M1R5S2]|uniref:FhaA domain-containing protein n=1 Tax=Kocuria rhizosphaerae TaxID=3376285 RepID=UPI00378FFFD4
MGFLDSLEKNIEKAVRATFATGSRKRVEAVEIASALRRELDQEAFTISAGRTMAPNVFVVEFSDEDFPRAQDWGTPLAEELCDVVIKHARSQAYTLQGAVKVSFARGSDVEAGQFRIHSSAQRTAESPNTPSTPSGHRIARGHRREEDEPTQAAAPVRHWIPVLDVEGERFSINAESIVLGRSTEADITVEDSGVSRKHLEIRRQGDHFVAVDLGSTNGSYVDGERVIGRTELVNGSVITMGRTRITFRLLTPKGNR